MKVSLDLESWSNLLNCQAAGAAAVHWVSQPDFQRHLYVSESFEAIWGAPAAVMYDNPHYFDARVIDYSQQQLPEYLMCQMQQKAGEALFQIKAESGQTRWISDCFAQLYDHKGQAVAVTGVARDVTQQVQHAGGRDDFERLLAQQQNEMSRIGEHLHEALSLTTRATPVSHAALTTREQQCFVLLRRGLTAKEVAQQLHISHRTVEKHVDNVKTKFDCRSIVSVLNELDRLGLV